jgi:hypothetical protein
MNDECRPRLVVLFRPEVALEQRRNERQLVLLLICKLAVACRFGRHRVIRLTPDPVQASRQRGRKYSAAQVIPVTLCVVRAELGIDLVPCLA